jgi:hypothetical protein
VFQGVAQVRSSCISFHEASEKVKTFMEPEEPTHSASVWLPISSGSKCGTVCFKHDRCGRPADDAR